MKNFIRRKIPNLQKSILYIMCISLFAFLFFITLIYEHKTSNTDSTATSLIGGVIAFIAIFGLLFQLNKDMVLRNTAKDDLAASELKYRNLIENAGVVMYTTTLNGFITYASSKA